MGRTPTRDRIALFLPSLAGGGAERTMLDLARGIAESGRPVDLVLARAVGPYLELVPDGVRIVDLASSRVLASLPGLVRYLRRHRPRSLLSAMDHANLVAIAAGTLSRAPTRICVSVRMPPSLGLLGAPQWRNRLLPRLMRQFYPRAATVIAVSRGVADDLAQVAGLARQRIEVIYNPVVTPDLLTQAQAQADHPWLTDAAPPLLLAAGRLAAEKDFPTLLRAFSEVRATRSCRLMILGEGPERPQLQAQIRELRLADQVALPGFVANPFAYMRQAALFVLSSTFEGLPGVLIQAMACGTPVASTDCPSGPREILEDGRYGALVPVGQPHALAAAMRQTLDCPPEGAALQRRAADFSLHKSTREYLAVLAAES